MAVPETKGQCLDPSLYNCPARNEDGKCTHALYGIIQKDKKTVCPDGAGRSTYPKDDDGYVDTGRNTPGWMD